MHLILRQWGLMGARLRHSQALIRRFSILEFSQFRPGAQAAQRDPPRTIQPFILWEVVEAAGGRGAGKVETAPAVTVPKNLKSAVAAPVEEVAMAGIRRFPT